MEDLKIEQYRSLLKSIDDIAFRMPDLIYLNYFDTSKYLYSAYSEAFKLLESFCEVIKICGIGQSASLLRMAIEFASIAEVLNKYPEVNETYIDHYNFRYSISNLRSSEQRDKICEKYKHLNIKSRDALNFIDYGWLSSLTNDKNCGQHELVRLAGFEDIIPWIDKLNSFIHGTYVFANLADPEGVNSIKMSHFLIDIAAKLLDHLCVSFHNKTNFDFVFDGEKKFDLFRMYYKSI